MDFFCVLCSKSGGVCYNVSTKGPAVRLLPARSPGSFTGKGDVIRMTMKKFLCIVLLACVMACLGAACGRQAAVYYTGLPEDTDTVQWQLSEERGK